MCNTRSKTPVLEPRFPVKSSTVSNPLVSVLVLSYNRRQCTLECLESVRRQTYRPIEMVVLDNGSRDGSADAVAAEFPEATLIRMPCNYGDWEGRDIAAANCRGEFLFSLDNDATAEPDLVEKLVARMRLEPEVAAVQPRVVDPKTFEVEDAGISTQFCEQEHYRASFLGGAALFRMGALRAAGGFPHYLLGGAEAHLTYRFLDMGYRILYFPGGTIYHAKSSQERVPHQRYYLITLQRLRALMAHYPGLIRPLVELHWKPASYALGAIRRGFLRHVPGDVLRLWLGGLRAWRGPWRIKKSTVRLVDFLKHNAVTSQEEYVAISTRHTSLFTVAIRRLRYP